MIGIISERVDTNRQHKYYVEETIENTALHCLVLVMFSHGQGHDGSQVSKHDLSIGGSDNLYSLAITAPLQLSSQFSIAKNGVGGTAHARGYCLTSNTPLQRTRVALIGSEDTIATDVLCVRILDR